MIRLTIKTIACPLAGQWIVDQLHTIARCRAPESAWIEIFGISLGLFVIAASKELCVFTEKNYYD